MVKDFYDEARAVSDMTEAINRKIKYDSEYKVIESKRSLRNDLAQESNSSNQNELNQLAKAPVVSCQCNRSSEHGSARQKL